MSRRPLPGRMARICSSNTRTVRKKSSCLLARRSRAIRPEVPRTSRSEPRSSSAPHKSSRMDRSPRPTSPLAAISILPSERQGQLTSLTQRSRRRADSRGSGTRAWSVARLRQTRRNARLAFLLDHLGRTGAVGQAGVAHAHRPEIFHPARGRLLRRPRLERCLHHVEAVVALRRLEPGELRLTGGPVERTGEQPHGEGIAVLLPLRDGMRGASAACAHPGGFDLALELLRPPLGTQENLYRT